VRRPFEQKKIRGVAPNAYITTLKRNAPTFVNLQEKKWQILTRFCAGDDPGRTLELRVRNFLPDFFFNTERKKTHYCNLPYNFFVF
jgi:hypothetical protein